MNFPLIHDIANFRVHVKHREEIREADIGHDSTSFCYMISGQDTFENEWLCECRGIVFDQITDSVSGRAMHKFFNVGEREETRIENLDWSKVVRVLDKRDGSMIHTVDVGGRVVLKSKKSFDSEVAKAATHWINRPENKSVLEMCQSQLLLNHTVTFEWTAPDARIVLFYPEPELTVLHIRDNITGEYMGGEYLAELTSKFNVKLVEEVNLQKLFAAEDEFWYGAFDIKTCDPGQLRERIEWLVKNVREVEGWIFQFANGDMVKLKTEWYLKRHRAMTFVRERDIAQLVLDEGLDDMKSMLVAEGVNISRILEIEAEVVNEINSIASSIDHIVKNNSDLSRKDFAMQFKGYKDFGLLMAKFNGKELDVKSYFEKNILKEKYSLKQVVMNPSIGEAE